MVHIIAKILTIALMALQVATTGMTSLGLTKWTLRLKNERRLDTRTPEATSAANLQLETVATIYWADKP